MTTYRPFIVIDAPGHYGREGVVHSTHNTLAAAIRARGSKLALSVAHNEAERNGGRGYVRGDHFWADMPPLQSDRQK